MYVISVCGDDINAIACFAESPSALSKIRGDRWWLREQERERQSGRGREEEREDGLNGSEPNKYIVLHTHTRL